MRIDCKLLANKKKKIIDFCSDRNCRFLAYSLKRSESERYLRAWTTRLEFCRPREKGQRERKREAFYLRQSGTHDPHTIPLKLPTLHKYKNCSHERDKERMPIHRLRACWLIRSALTQHVLPILIFQSCFCVSINERNGKNTERLL